jgi:hypothetical protein
MMATASSNVKQRQAGQLTVAEVAVSDVQTAHAYRHGDRLMVLIGDEVFALPRMVAYELAWDMCSQLEAMRA